VKHSATVAILCLALADVAHAAPTMPPQLPPNGLDEYRAYIEAPDHRAFAIAPGGAWGWTSAERSAQVAEENALAICQGQTDQHCVSYAVDGNVTFDAATWSKLWRPYPTTAQASRAATGNGRGQRMFDLAFKDADGKARQLSSLRGKVVVLHFWGAWCPPCRREMPDLQKVTEAMAARKDIAFVILQAREKFEVSTQWAAKQGIALPLADSGSKGDDDTMFHVAGGREVKDREIANRFPTTYVLDRHGVVVFAHVGPVHDWPQYEAFLRDLADSAKR